MTQTPASGPFAPVTTPPMSSASMATVSACRAPARPRARPAATAKAMVLMRRMHNSAASSAIMRRMHQLRRCVPASAVRRRPRSRAAASARSADAPEIDAAAKLIRAAPQFPADGQFATIVLKEPPKANVLAFTPGATFARQAFAIVLDRRGNRTYEAVVDLNASSVLSWTEVKGVQPPVLDWRIRRAVEDREGEPATGRRRCGSAASPTSARCRSTAGRSARSRRSSEAGG